MRLDARVAHCEQVVHSLVVDLHVRHFHLKGGVHVAARGHLLEQSVTEARNEAFVVARAHHGVALAGARLMRSAKCNTTQISIACSAHKLAHSNYLAVCENASVVTLEGGLQDGHAELLVDQLLVRKVCVALIEAPERKVEGEVLGRPAILRVGRAIVGKLERNLLLIALDDRLRA